MVVAATLVVVTTALLAPYSLISYRADAQKQRDALRGLMLVQADELSVALALPVWNIDRAQINRVIDAMARRDVPNGIHENVFDDVELVSLIRSSDLHPFSA